MDATHFRHRAERARELARTGDDPRLAMMLLEVAVEMEAEAEAMDAAAEPGTQSANGRLKPTSSQPSDPLRTILSGMPPRH